MKHLFTTCLVLSFLVFTNSAFSQQNNLNEDYSAYLPEVRTVNQYIARMLTIGTLTTKEGLAATRKTMEPSTPAKTQLQPSVKNIQGPGGNISLRIFKPDTIRAVVMNIHGGGWCLGTASGDDMLNDEMARTCKVAVVSVDYRLAPENPFPACIDDCKAVAKWLVNNARKEFGTDNLFISGNSAGGHLSAVVTLYIRDSLRAINKVKGVNLMNGCFDLSRTPSCRMATDSTLILTKKALNEMWVVAFPGWNKDELQDPRYSPLFADLKNLPPAYFTVGTKDPLIDDTFFMEARWRLAGNKTYLAVYPEGAHGLNYFPVKMAMVANKKMYDWIIGLSKEQ